MSELAKAIEFATRVLDNDFQDPDRSTAVLARQFVRAIELLEKNNWLDGQSPWQPIETCPKDGTIFLVGREGVEFSKVVAFRKGSLRDDDNYPYHPSGFTHWQPLPAPPRAKAQGEKK